MLAKTIWTLIKKSGSSKKIAGAKTLIIGNSEAFTGPLEAYLRHKRLLAKHIHFKDIKKFRKLINKFDIVIIAVGSANFFKAADFKDDAIIIDVGINKLPNGKIAGDVDSNSLKNKKVFLTPVPGGVGPVTVATLLENTYLLAKK